MILSFYKVQLQKLFHFRIKDSYTIQEDMDILKYIEQHRVFHRVGGRELWQDMAMLPAFSCKFHAMLCSRVEWVAIFCV